MGKTATPLVKICGITREADAQGALVAGADAIGLNFYPSSPRYVEPAQAADIARLTGDKALKVGLFVDASVVQIQSVLERVPLDILQFHGSETPQFCSSFRQPYWKVFRVKDTAVPENLEKQINMYEDASAILLDAWHPTQHGGTGLSFDWTVLKAIRLDNNLVLAGGLNPDNVAEAVKTVRPWGIDVSSGVEEAPGIKSETLMQQFIEEVKSV